MNGVVSRQTKWPIKSPNCMLGTKIPNSCALCSIPRQSDMEKVVMILQSYCWFNQISAIFFHKKRQEPFYGCSTLYLWFLIIFLQSCITKIDTFSMSAATSTKSIQADEMKHIFSIIKSDSSALKMYKINWPWQSSTTHRSSTTGLIPIKCLLKLKKLFALREAK